MHSTLKYNCDCLSASDPRRFSKCKIFLRRSEPESGHTPVFDLRDRNIGSSWRFLAIILVFYMKWTNSTLQPLTPEFIHIARKLE